MNKNIINRIIEETKYMLKTKSTVREIAKIFNVSKSTVHKDLHERLKEIDYKNYLIVDNILQYHTNIKHIRGGESTRQKYLKNTKNW